MTPTCLPAWRWMSISPSLSTGTWASTPCARRVFLRSDPIFAVGVKENRVGFGGCLSASACGPGLPRTSVLGHSQPSLAGLFLALKSTQDWRPGLLSAVPSGLDLERVVLTQAL